MYFTVGDILMGAVVLLSLLSTVIAIRCWLAERARPVSKRGSASTPQEKDLPPLESRLRDLEVELASLSSSFEKVTKLVQRLNSRAGMRELRAAEGSAESPPPLGAPKADILRFAGMAGKLGPDFARAQLAKEKSDGQ